MALIRWEPFQEVEALQRQMNRLFDEMMPITRDPGSATAFIPPVEMEETADAICIKLEIPGMNPNDLNVQVSTEAVYISGERKSEIRKEQKGEIRTEFRYGNFQRVIPVPKSIQNDKAKAEYKDGVLKLTLPKAEENKDKIVKINISNGR